MRVLVNAFIIFHILALTLWTLPPLHPTEQPQSDYGGINAMHDRLCVGWCARVMEPAFRYVTWAGLWQAWEIFSPTPWIANMHLKAEVERSDGTREVWHAPVPAQSSYSERYLKARYIYWRNTLKLREFKTTRSTAACYIGRLYAGTGAPPKNISLILEWTFIPAPIAGDEQPILSPYPMNNFSVLHEQPLDDGSCK